MNEIDESMMILMIDCGELSRKIKEAEENPEVVAQALYEYLNCELNRIKTDLYTLIKECPTVIALIETMDGDYWTVEQFEENINNMRDWISQLFDNGELLFHEKETKSRLNHIQIWFNAFSAQVRKLEYEHGAVDILDAEAEADVSAIYTLDGKRRSALVSGSVIIIVTKKGEVCKVYVK